MNEMKVKRYRGMATKTAHLIFLFFMSHFVTWSLCPCASAQVPKLIRYQGTLVNATNVPLEGTYNLTFRLYQASSGGAAVWMETQSAIAISRGIFSVLLGQTTPLTVSFDREYWLTTQVGIDAEMSPRQRLTSVPYAYRAGVADQTQTQPPDSRWIRPAR